MENNKKKLITHNGTFHADDLFAAGVLSLVMQNENMLYEIIRTRDLEMIKNADYVFDVGGEYNPDTNRFDHHQKGGAGVRDNGIPYASFGLVWKHFGQKLCDGNMDAWKIIDDKIACSLDAFDNGVDLVKSIFKNLNSYSVAESFLVFMPTWKEDENNIDHIFFEQVKKVVDLLKREIKVALDDAEGKEIILSAYKNSEDKRLVVLDKSFPRYLYQNTLSSVPEPIYVVYPSAHGPSYKVEAISKNYKETMESRKSFPESWSGFMNNDPKAKEIIGIDGVIFTHIGKFYANVDTKEHAIEFAKKALLI